MKPQTVLACAGLSPDQKNPLCERSDECAHYEEWWLSERHVQMNLCTQAGGAFKMFMAWRPLVRSAIPLVFQMKTQQGELFA